MAERREAPARVLQVFASLDRGGAEQLVSDWYREMERDKVQFDFIAYERSRPYDHEDTLRSMGARIYKVPYPWGPKFLSSFWQLGRLLRDHPEWKVIHAHYGATSPFLFGLARLQGRRCISHGHDAQRGLQWPLYLLGFSIANARIACSKEVEIEKFGPFDAEVLPNGTKSSHFRYQPDARGSLSAELGLGDGLLLGHIGRFSEPKNHSFLLEVFAEVLTVQADANLLLVGQGALRPDIEQMAADLGISDRVLFLGLRTDIPRIMSALDLLIMPSISEGMPITMIEAQANGLPCLVSDAVSDDSVVPGVGIVEVLPLSASVKTWSRHAVAMASADHDNRAAAAEGMISTPYDVSTSARRLLEIYGF